MLPKQAETLSQPLEQLDIQDPRPFELVVAGERAAEARIVKQHTGKPSPILM